MKYNLTNRISIRRKVRVSRFCSLWQLQGSRIFSPIVRVSRGEMWSLEQSRRQMDPSGSRGSWIARGEGEGEEGGKERKGCAPEGRGY